MFCKWETVNSLPHIAQLIVQSINQTAADA
uniref:Uncharacterized protein n=1 Tax=Arundo donax TaxID=35708 RepID=A0A0A9BCR3_ARUDO